MKYYYTYVVTLTEGSLKDKVYFGKHITDNLNDGYIGSGKILRDYLNKYPDGYYREILQYYNTKEELAKAEYELIQPHLGEDYCINLKRGGEGGCRVHILQETKDKMSIKAKERFQDSEFKERWKKKMKEVYDNPEYHQKLSETHKGENHPMYGKNHSEESKKKMSESRNKYLQEHPESRAQCCWNKGLKNCFSEETKKKMSESRKKYLQEHPEARAKCAWSKGTKGLIKSKIKGKHRVYDNKELNIYHYE